MLNKKVFLNISYFVYVHNHSQCSYYTFILYFLYCYCKFHHAFQCIPHHHQLSIIPLHLSLSLSLYAFKLQIAGRQKQFSNSNRIYQFTKRKSTAANLIGLLVICISLLQSYNTIYRPFATKYCMLYVLTLRGRTLCFLSHSGAKPNPIFTSPVCNMMP